MLPTSSKSEVRPCTKESRTDRTVGRGQFDGVCRNCRIDRYGLRHCQAGSMVGVIGVPHGPLPYGEVFFRNIGWKGGPAPARLYIPELLDDVLAGRINPGRVFDYETNLDGTPDAYAAMDERRAIKSLIRIRIAVSDHSKSMESS